MKSMTQHRAILKLLFFTNLSPSAIARTRGKSHNTVIDLRDRAVAVGLTQEKMDGLTDSELFNLLYPKSQKADFIYPVWECEVAYMEKGYNRTEAHIRYQEEVGPENSLTYSTYCKQLKKYLGSLRKVFRHIHRPGYATQIDFAGYEPEGLDGGLKTKFQLFVAVLPASSLTFATIVRSQKISDHNEAIIRIFEYVGGVSEVVISDNLKAAVIKWNGRNGPVINASFLELSDYYGFLPKPTRVAKPKDKAAIENAVKYVQRLLRQVLRNQPLMELASMELVLQGIVNTINNRKMKRRGKNRFQRFEELEKKFLLPLPTERKVYMDPARIQVVKPDYHVVFDNAYYSVPHRLTGLEVSIRANSRNVEIQHDGKLVALHRRTTRQYYYVTKDEHRHPNHSLYNKIAFDDWLSALPENIRKVSSIVIGNSQKQRKRERLIARVRNLIRVYTKERVEMACKQAISNQAPNFKHVENLLRNNLEQREVANDIIKLTHNKAKKNIRGGDYFFPSSPAGES